jgi:hypothetical protein
MTFQEQFIIDLQKFLKLQVPEFRYIDENLGQWGDQDFRSAVSFPAILIDFPDTSYSELGADAQLATVSIELTLLFSVTSQSYNLAPEDVRKKALNYYDLENKLLAKLKLFEKDYFTPLVRTRAVSRNKNELGLRIREISFSSEFEETYDDGTTLQDYEIDFTGELG